MWSFSSAALTAGDWRQTRGGEQKAGSTLWTQQQVARTRPQELCACCTLTTGAVKFLPPFDIFDIEVEDLA